MKTRNSSYCPYSLALLIAGTVCLQSSAQNLILNGNFDLNPTFNDWNLNGTSVYLSSASGVQFVNGDGGAVGLDWQSTLSQAVPTVAGQQYILSFYMADWASGGSVPNNVVELTPSFGAVSLGTDTFNGAGNTYQNMGWEQFDYTVTATSSSTTLSFENPGVSGVNGQWAMLDEVDLTLAPEPSEASLLALSALFFVSFRFVQKRSGRNSR